MLYSDRVRIENSKFSNTFLSAKSDDYASAGGSFIAKPRKGKELERSLAQLVRLDIPHALLTQSCVQASSDYRCAPPLAVLSVCTQAHVRTIQSSDVQAGLY